MEVQPLSYVWVCVSHHLRNVTVVDPNAAAVAAKEVPHRVGSEVKRKARLFLVAPERCNEVGLSHDVPSRASTDELVLWLGLDKGPHSVEARLSEDCVAIASLCLCGFQEDASLRRARRHRLRRSSHHVAPPMSRHSRHRTRFRGTRGCTA